MLCCEKLASVRSKIATFYPQLCKPTKPLFGVDCCDADIVPQPRRNTSNCGIPTIFPQVSLARIVGGVEARAHSWPWQCSIRMMIGEKIYHVCGASVLSDRFVISAAHCV